MNVDYIYISHSLRFGKVLLALEKDKVMSLTMTWNPNPSIN